MHVDNPASRPDSLPYMRYEEPPLPPNGCAQFLVFVAFIIITVIGAYLTRNW